MIFQFVVSLGVLLAILWIVYLIINGKFSRGFPGKNIIILEKKYLDKNSMIVLVRLMDDYYFLLVTQGGGTIIKKLDELEAGKIMTQEGEGDFKRIFGRRFGRKL